MVDNWLNFSVSCILLTTFIDCLAVTQIAVRKKKNRKYVDAMVVKCRVIFAAYMNEIPRWTKID
jgi:hypothetical protein